jgi:hypothetical protein
MRSSCPLWPVCGPIPADPGPHDPLGISHSSADLGFLSGAGDGNRTRMASLEGWGSTIELRPRNRSGGASHLPACIAYRTGLACETAPRHLVPG